MHGKDHDWSDYWRVQKDICFFYHEQAGFDTILGDLAYGSIYGESYWEFLETEEGLGDEDHRFIRDGCLLLILAMAVDRLEGSGFYIDDRRPACIAAVERIDAGDDRTRRLVGIVREALDATAEPVAGHTGFEESLAWVSREYVGRYFTETARRRLRRPG